jgi:transposase
MAGQPKKRQRKRKPTKAQSKVREDLIENLRTGMTIEAACLLAGIGRTTYYRWLDEDEKWADECKSAVRFAEAVLLERVKQLAMDKMDWRAFAWILEKRFPDDYGKRQELKVESSTSSDGTAEVLAMLEQVKEMKHSASSEEEAEEST